MGCRINSLCGVGARRSAPDLSCTVCSPYGILVLWFVLFVFVVVAAAVMRSCCSCASSSSSLTSRRIRRISGKAAEERKDTWKERHRKRVSEQKTITTRVFVCFPALCFLVCDLVFRPVRIGDMRR